MEELITPSKESYGLGMQLGRRKQEMHRGLRWGNVLEGDHFEDQELDGRIVLKWI
jgi:hypothetical protein